MSDPPDSESELCAEWTNCVDGYCFRGFNGHLDYASAEDVCASYGGRQATEPIPRAQFQVYLKRAYLGQKHKDKNTQSGLLLLDRSG